jgi:hypothetical protein
MLLLAKNTRAGFTRPGRKEHDMVTPALPADPVSATGSLPGTKILRTALTANAVFSLGTGLSLAAAGPWLADAWAAGPRWLLPVLGAAVAAFGLVVARVAVQPTRRLRRQARAVVVADVLWVLVSTAVTAARPLTGAGNAVAVAVAVVVTALAGWQVLGLHRSRNRDPFDDDEVVEVGADVRVGAEAVWPLVVDHDLYGRLAPGLRSVEVISEPGDPLRRRCTNSSGDSWQETCTLWEDGRRFAVEVDTTDYPYPLASMRGLWQVDRAQDGARVTMRFAYRARPTFAGGLFALAFRLAFPHILRRIIAGWRTRLEHPVPSSA